MFDPKQLDEVTERLLKAMPAGLREMSHDVEKNLRAGLQSAFTRLDLVSREEFEVQAGVLARTRAKLEELEKQVAELERQLRPPSK